MLFNTYLIKKTYNNRIGLRSLNEEKPKFNNKKEIAANGKEGENQSRQEKGSDM
jgi:hypothetical protein